MNSLRELIIAQKENEELKKQIEAFKDNCDAMKDVIEQMKNCVNCKYSEDYDYYRDKKCCICSSKYSKWELKEE